MHNPSSLTVDSTVNFWPAVIDMLSSILMIILLIYFVQYYLRDENLEAAIAQQRRDRFINFFQGEFRGEPGISLEPEFNAVRIAFGEGVLFEVQNYDLRGRGPGVLQKLARIVARAQAEIHSQQLYKEILIEGHTDSDEFNSPEYPRDNWELSTARALEVLKFLARRAKPPLDEKTMAADGYASNRPKNDKMKSRRTEVRIFFSGKEENAKDGSTVRN